MYLWSTSLQKSLVCVIVTGERGASDLDIEIAEHCLSSDNISAISRIEVDINNKDH